ncbi:hypothetical protein GcM3_004020 [Golovinomyces cichoracearum]|uniref:Uncharacterized protein n=1 Tax=Golovinomyces cichoracearum TaxID=62708 RepID=A0A420JB31_9PEZI|nr:hypothetical protein GcM3_004020 [Golovinomyces cichoracearum]
MKYMCWIETRLLALTDGRTSKQEIKDDWVEEYKMPAPQNLALPIASAFSSASYTDITTPSATTSKDVKSDSPLISRPRPIAHNGTEKSFFSRGTISTENTNLPTRTHSKYRPSYSSQQDIVSVEKLPNQERILNIILELYPAMIKYVDSGTTSHRELYSSGSRSTRSFAFQSESKLKYTSSITGSHNLSSGIHSADHEHINLLTPPLSPMTPSWNFSPLSKTQSKVSGSFRESEYQQLKDFLINFLSTHGKQLSRELRVRILECFSITPAELASEQSWLWMDYAVSNDEDQNEKSELALKMLIEALKSQSPENNRYKAQNNSPVELQTMPIPTPFSKFSFSADETTKRVPDSQPSTQNSKIMRGFLSDANLEKHRTGSTISNRSAFFKGSSFDTLNKNISLFTSKLNPLGWKNSRDNLHVIHQRSLGSRG